MLEDLHPRPRPCCYPDPIRSEALGFVRRLTAHDGTEIATAIEAAKHSAAMGDGREKHPACEDEHDSLRLRLNLQ